MLTVAKVNDGIRFERNTEKLDEILNKHRSPVDKTGLGYTNTKPQRGDEGNSANSLRSKQKEVEKQQ